MRDRAEETAREIIMAYPLPEHRDSDGEMDGWTIRQLEDELMPMLTAALLRFGGEAVRACEWELWSFFCGNCITQVDADPSRQCPQCTQASNMIEAIRTLHPWVFTEGGE